MKKIVVAIICAVILFLPFAVITQADNITSINAPKVVKAINKNKKIVVKWSSVTKANGYVLFKNNKKYKTLKKKSFKDSKVKKNKTYKYYVLAFKKIGSKTIYSSKSLMVSAKKVNKKSKKVNASRWTNIKDSYSLCLNGTEKLNPKVKPSKKYKKKKVFDKSVRWISSNNSLATVSKDGRIVANNKMKKGKLFVYAIAHNGLRKKVTISISNFAYPSKFKNMYGVEEEVKPIVTTYKKEMMDIANYFEFVKEPINITFDMDGTGELSQSKETKIDDKIKEKLYKIIHNVPVVIHVTKKYVHVERVDKTVYNTARVNAIYYAFARTSQGSLGDGFGGLIDIAPHWYTQFYECPISMIE